MTISGKDFVAVAESEGFDFFTGVPCSLVGDAIAALETHPRLPYVPAVREDVAVGMAAGAWMAGRSPLVIMQNSGLGTSLNALVSLSLMYRLPRPAPRHLARPCGQGRPRAHRDGRDLARASSTSSRVPHRVLTAGERRRRHRLGARGGRAPEPARGAAPAARRHGHARTWRARTRGAQHARR